jgi:hypothetical protein
MEAKKKLVERFLRLSHIDPEVGVPQIVQPPEIEQLVADIKAEFSRRQEERRPFELQWRLNQNFLNGNQYCDIFAEAGEVKDFPTSFDWEMRTVYNQIAPITETRLSKLSRVQPGLVVRPVTADASDVMSARLSTRLLKASYASHEMSLKSKIANAWAEVCGGVFWKHEWNPFAGAILGYENGKPVYEGDIEVSVVPYYRIFPNTSYAHSLNEIDSIIEAEVITTDQAKTIFGLTLEGRTMNVFSMDVSGMVAGGIGYNSSMMQVKDNMIDNGVLVLMFRELPNRDFPEGRYVILVDDICVHLGVLPYRCDSYRRRGYPFVHQRCLDNPGVLWGTSVIERCIPVQRDYNAVRNRINEYIARMTIGNMAVEKGSLVDESILEDGLPPGSVIEYNPGSTPPQWMTPQEIPATLLQQVDALQTEFVNISGISELSRTSQAPPSISSGVALEVLKEQDDTRLTLTAENIREAMRQIGQHWLRLYKQYATAPRISRIAGESGGDIMATMWQSSDITSDDVIVDTDNEMTNTPAQRKQLALELLQAGLFFDPDSGRMTRETRAKLMEVFEMGNWENAIDIDELHSVRAQREAIELESGKLPKVMQLDNHTTHISEHIKYALGAEFRHLQETKPELAREMLGHIEEHKQIAVQHSMALAGQGAGNAPDMAASGMDQEAAMNMAAVQEGSVGGNRR